MFQMSIFKKKEVKFKQAKQMVDAFIDEIESLDDEIQEEAIERGMSGMEQYLDLYGIEDEDDRLEMAIAGVYVAYVYIEKLMKEKGMEVIKLNLFDGEA